MLNETPYFSIVVPIYNVENYIERFINSVLAQDFCDFEVLLVNDGSKDNSIDKINFVFSDTRFKLINKTNGGLSDARNAGLKKATGSYVLFWDSDDWVESNTLSELYNFLKVEVSSCLVFGFFRDTENLDNVLINTTTQLPEFKTLNIANTTIKLSNDSLSYLGYAWNKVYERSLLVSNDLWFDKGISLVEDMLFNSKVYRSIDKIHFLSIPLYHYMDRPSTSLIKQFHPNSFELIIIKMEAIKNFLTHWKLASGEIKKVVAYNLFLGIRYCIHNLFYYKNGLSIFDKHKYVKEMMQNKLVNELLNDAPKDNFIDRIYLFCFRYKTSQLLTLLALIKK